MPLFNASRSYHSWFQPAAFFCAVFLLGALVVGGILNTLAENSALPSVEFGYDNAHALIADQIADPTGIVDLRIAAAIDVDNPHPLIRLLEVSQKMGDTISRVDALRGLLRHDPRSGLLHSEMAAALLNVNRPDEAHIHSTLAVRLEPDEGRCYLIHGSVLLALEQKSAAAEAFRQALQRDSSLTAAESALQYALQGY